MELLLVAPEITPYSRSGEIGDVCAALPKTLRGGGHKVTVISPLWPGIDPTARGLARRLSGVEVRLGAQRFACTLHDGRTTGGVDLVFVGHPDLFAPGPGGDASPERVRAALVFAEAVAQVAGAREPAPDVVHAHGWFAAAALPLLQRTLPDAARVLSLHDPGAQGRLGAELDEPELPEAIAALAGTGAQRSLLRAGVAAAQAVVAASYGEAQAVREGQLGLADALVNDEALSAIPNGLDAARWNPLTDPLLPSRFDPVDLRGKARCKDALQLELGLPIRPDVPLLACIGRLGRTEGGALLEQALDPLLRSDAQIVIAGSDPALEHTVRALVPRHEERLRGAFPVDERNAHRAIAAADLLLVPAIDRAFADLHLCGQRYGALPIARKVGAMADSVVDADAQLTTGSGFLFEGEDPAELVATVQRAFAAFGRRNAFEALRQRTMKLDVSWDRSARRYEHLYKSLKA